MDDENIRLSFQKVRNDIDWIKEEIELLKQNLYENNRQLTDFAEVIKELSLKFIDFAKEENSTYQREKPTNPAYITANPTYNELFKPQKVENIDISTGNGGVPTDRQTNQQTDRQTDNSSLNDSLAVLDSLDSLKKEIRNKFKRITDQEFLVFSTIYQLEDKEGFTDYKAVSQRLDLTESSIRDYVGKLIKKGIPIKKNRLNNKLIQLSISENLKKIAPLPVILQLRQL